MTTDLWMLVATTLWCAFIPTLSLFGRFQTPGGMTWALGNRDTPLETADWVRRGDRAHMNTVENLPLFTVLVLVAHLTGSANATTALGATFFFLARVAHTLIYVAGIPVARTIAYGVSVVGMLMILFQLF